MIATGRGAGIGSPGYLDDKAESGEKHLHVGYPRSDVFSVVLAVPMNLSVFGAGRLGLVTGACLAERGNRVVCIDINADLVEDLERGAVPVHEPGLAQLLANGRRARRLAFTTDAARGVAHGDILFIAVGTPPTPDGSADITSVLEVASAVGHHLNAAKIVAVKSTVPVGTGHRIRDRIAAVLADRGASAANVHILSNPEFLKEGAAVADFMRPDRVVIGSDSPAAAIGLERLYAPFNRNRDRIVHMDIRSAELTKYAANAMLATRISLMNELANLAERLDADIDSVRRGIGSDPRIGPSFLYPGIGYGGPCLPKDIQALIGVAKRLGSGAEMLRSVEAVNTRQKELLFGKIRSYFDDGLVGREIALWGLAFKPHTDDMRDAPSRILMERLWQAGATVRAYDPAARGSARRIYGDRPDLVLCEHRDDAPHGADALAIVTEWPEFWNPDFQVLRRSLRRPAIFDGRNLYDPAKLREMGFDHFPVGRPPSLRMPVDAQGVVAVADGQVGHPAVAVDPPARAGPGGDAAGGRPDAVEVLVEGLVAGVLAGEQEVAAGVEHRAADGLAGVQVVAEVDRPQCGAAVSVAPQPALDRLPFAREAGPAGTPQAAGEAVARGAPRGGCGRAGGRGRLVLRQARKCECSREGFLVPGEVRRRGGATSQGPKDPQIQARRNTGNGEDMIVAEATSPARGVDQAIKSAGAGDHLTGCAARRWQSVWANYRSCDGGCVEPVERVWHLSAVSAIGIEARMGRDSERGSVRSTRARPPKGDRPMPVFTETGTGLRMTPAGEAVQIREAQRTGQEDGAGAGRR